MSKHIYTCPDVIHQRKIARRLNIANLAVLGLTVIGTTVWAWREDKKDPLKDLEFTTEDTEA